MPVLELATLQLFEPHHFYSETVHKHFRTLSQWQAEWSGYPLTFYTSNLDDATGEITDPTTVFLISGWKSVDAHNEWIKSEGNQELLRLLLPFLSIKDFVHLAVDFDDIPRDCGELFLAITSASANHMDARPDASESHADWCLIGRDAEPNVDKTEKIYRLAPFKAARTEAALEDNNTSAENGYGRENQVQDSGKTGINAVPFEEVRLKHLNM
ncbi:hypothetical protein AX16_007030 [Volvariella volvacea WC 439]|nr:hypothetical protein AX16_007030 [Volvariella volvacea WC 439]